MDFLPCDVCDTLFSFLTTLEYRRQCVTVSSSFALFDYLSSCFILYPHGTFDTWHKVNGVPCKSTRVVGQEGILLRSVGWYPNGAMQARTEHEHHKLNGKCKLIHYHENKVKESEGFILNCQGWRRGVPKYTGLLRRWHNNTNIRSEHTYDANGIPIGTHIYYAKDGVKDMDVIYHGGYDDIEEVEYDSDGIERRRRRISLPRSV